MKTSFLASRWQRLQLPTGMLIVLLQRTPAPVLRVLDQLETVVLDRAPLLLRSSLVATAMGAYHSVAGATVFNVSPATPASGAANSNFTVTGTTGTALSVGISVSGAPGNPKSWSVKTTTPLPPGLSVTGGNPVNVTAPYKMTIAGTPTTAGTTACTVTAWDSLNGAGGNSAKITVTFSITGGGPVNTAPSITSQPSSQTITIGNSVTFSVAASGTPAPTFQWNKGGVPIAGATGTSYTIAAVATGDGGTYTATATNVAGSATSNGAVLTVQTTPPTFTTQPNSQTITVGSSATFSVAATGAPTPTLQWNKNGVAIGGATGTSYTIAAVVNGDAGTYTATATNVAGSVTSSGAVLTVQAPPPPNTAPTITTQPSSQTITAGNPVTFTVAANGNPTPTFQWNKGGVPIAGATGPNYTITAVANGDAGTYTATATNSAGSATSNGAALTVQAAPPTTTAPAITAQPSSQTVTAGAPVTFSVAASGNPAPTFQWNKDGAPIGGATGTSYTISAAASGDAGTYTATATNSAGSATSTGATLTVQAAPPVNTAPAITTQPVSQSVTIGGSVTFTVAASGTPTPTYQWNKGGVAIAGATNTSYTIAAATSGDAGSYTATATNAAGAATSSAATLTVQAAPPANTAPSITMQPTSQTVTAGESVTFTVGASGNPVPTYQWSKGGAAIAGATSASFVIAAAATTDAGTYTVLVSNSAGNVTSSGAVLVVGAAPPPPPPPTASFFSYPSGITFVGPDGLFVSDSSGDTVQKVTTAGSVTLLAGTSGSAGTSNGTGAAALFNQPGGVVAASTGVIYVADTANAMIRRVGTDGSVTTFAGSSTTRGNTDAAGASASFSAPLGLALDAAGNLYVADAMNHTIRKITSAGVVSTLAGSPGVSGFADGTGAAARFNYPAGLATDPAGNVYVADQSNSIVRKITAAGVVTTLAGLQGVSGSADGTGSNALFNQPAGVILDSAGNVYVADTGNSTIRKVTPAGVVSTLAGLPAISGNQDGTGSGAMFNQPRALTIDSGGNLYVADTGNASIRKVTPAGVVSTLTLQQGTANPGSGGGSTGGGTTTTTTGGSASSAPNGNGAGSLGGWFVAGLGLLVLLRWPALRRI